MLRKLFANALLAVLLLPLLAPLLALGQGAEAGLPACCRRDGAHHCAMSVGERAAVVRGEGFRAPAMRCPYAPATVVSAHPVLLALPAPEVSVRLFAGQLAGVVQAECKRRISRDRSRQKRGPPPAERCLLSA